MPALQLSKTAVPAMPLAGERLTYTLRVTNTGGTVPAVAVQDHIPVNTTFASASNGGVSQGGEVTWSNLPLADS
jgi:uncharacterized repeat protein (TIGR01451 family)